MTSSKEKLLTVKDIENGSDFPVFNSEKERLRYMRIHYSKLSIGDSFIKFFNIDSKREQESLKNAPDTCNISACIGSIITLDVSKIVDGEVYCNNNYKETIKVIDDLRYNEEHFRRYLKSTGGKVSAMVRRVIDNIIYCSIKDACVAKWWSEIYNAIKSKKAINVHIDRLFDSGYICSTLIYTAYKVLGINLYEQVFIPGSLIVINIERDFNRWVGQDVLVIPKSVTTFKENSDCKPVKCVVCSRKDALRKQAETNLYHIFNESKFVSKFGGVYDKRFPGEVSGKINTTSKTGVFVEFDDLYITGLYTCDKKTFDRYNIGDRVNVKITKFERKDGVNDDFVVKNNKIITCNIRPVLEIVE